MKSLNSVPSKKRKEKVSKILCTFLWEDRADMRTEYLKIDLPPGIVDDRSENDLRIQDLENRLKRMSGQLETAHNDLKIRTERERMREKEMMKQNDPMKFEFDDIENDDDTLDSLNQEISRLSGLVQGNKDRLSAEAVVAKDRAEDAEKMYKKMLKDLREEMAMEKKKWAAENKKAPKGPLQPGMVIHRGAKVAK